MKKDRHYLYILLAISLLVLASLACGSSNEGTIVTPEVEEAEQVETTEVEVADSEEPEKEVEEVEETDPEDADEEEAEPEAEELELVEPEEVEEVESSQEEDSEPTFDLFEVGDLIEVEEHTIRLNSIEYLGDVLVANFTVENDGSSDLAVSSIMSFSAKNNDGTLLEQEIFDCDASNIDGSVLAGDKLRGSICWSGANPENEIKIYYEPNLFGQGAIVWNAVEGVAEELVSDSDTSSQIETFQVGDLIETQDHTIRLNGIEYQGNVLKSDFTIENTGDSDIGVSSMLSLSAKRNDGTVLEQEIFDCGPSGLDGKVLPGDRLRGMICWSEATPEDEIKIYYEADMFGEGAIVWEGVEGTADPLELSDAELKVEVHNVGDVVEVDEHTISLNSIEFLGNILKANFTLENQGSSDVAVSSMISFDARNRDGFSLEQNIFDCGSSFDGSVIPGDLLTGDICWDGASQDAGIKVYYESDPFGEGAIVWTIE